MGGSAGSTQSSGLSPLGTQSWLEGNNLIQNLIGTQAPNMGLTGSGTTALNSGIGALMGAGGQAQNYISQLLGGSAMNPLSNPGTQPTLDLYNKNYTTGLNQSVDSLNAIFQNAGQGNSGVEANLGTQFGRGALSDYQNNVGSLLSGLYNTGVGQTENALSSSALPGQLFGQATSMSQMPQQLALQQFMLQQQLNQAPISDLAALTGMGTYSQGESQGPAWWQNMLPTFGFNFGGSNGGGAAAV
jgi:hypothetical protein